jgi:RNA polymerase sigma factor (sigma-70 family)
VSQTFLSLGKAFRVLIGGMINSGAMETIELSDADLVAETLGGDREAFGHIVERYQTLLASLAYCATGNVSQSEDLAQETFVTAWKQLPELREPAKLRPWLCGIIRFLIGKEIRRQDHEPIHEAESLDAVDDWPSPEPLPPDHAISQEEVALLWRSLERIPPAYREPLVLFYREHQSIEAVAQGLGISEDAVKQRLSRGRKHLQEQFLAFVAGALDQTRPAKTFALGVLAALPLGATAKGATVGTALANHGGVAAKTTSSGGMLQAFAHAVMGMVCWVGPALPLLGGYVGYKMGGDRQKSERARQLVASFWRIMGVSMLLFVALPPVLRLTLLNLTDVSPSKLNAAWGLWGQLCLPILLFGAVPLSLVLWIWQRRRRAAAEGGIGGPIYRHGATSITLWAGLAMTGALVYLAYTLYSSVISPHVPNPRNLSTAEVQKLITDSKGRDIHFVLSQLASGYRLLSANDPENGTQSFFVAPAENSTMALLAEKGISFNTYIENRDFTIATEAAWLLRPFCVFILLAGGLTLLRGRPNRQSGQPFTTDPRRERRVDKAFAALAACGMVALAVLLGVHTDWKVHEITADQLPPIVAQHPGARFEVFEYPDGSQKLWISDQRTPDFIAPANEPTLGVLTRQGIAYQTYVARMAGIPGPSRSASVGWILALAAGAGGLLWWMLKGPKQLEGVVTRREA